MEITLASGCYTPEYLPASYKGVPFQAMDVTSTHGRRGAVGEFPFGDNPAYADLGRRVRKYTIRARFVENSHVSDANALILACESKGSGPLVHPTRGLVNVACVTATFRDDILEEQGVSYADLEFVEANDWPSGAYTGGNIARLVTSGFLSTVLSSFLSGYSPKNVQVHRRQDLINQASAIVSSISEEYTSATASLRDENTRIVSKELNSIAGDFGRLADSGVLSEAIFLGMSAISSKLVGDQKFQSMKRIANSISFNPLPSSAYQSQSALNSTTRLVASAYMGQGALEQKITTSAEAFLYYNNITTLLTEEATIAYDSCDNRLFLAIKEYMVNVQTLILDKAYNTPALIRYSMPGGFHPVVAAYILFGDAKRHVELEVGNSLYAGKFSNNIIASGA